MTIAMFQSRGVMLAGEQMILSRPTTQVPASELPAIIALHGHGGEAALMRINDAMLALEAVDPALAQVVEMRYFAGYSELEVAQLLGSSERTVRRQWEKARAFLLATMRE